MLVQDLERDGHSSKLPLSPASPSEQSPLLPPRHGASPGTYGSRGEQEPTEETPDDSTPKGIFAIIGLLLIGVFIGNVDSTLVLATYSTISSEFGALEIGSWLSTSYMLATTAVQPSIGKLSDIYGRKPVLLISYALFGAGTVVIGVARSMWQVILGRVISGLGAAGMTVIVSILITDLVPLIRVAAWRSYVNVVSTLGRSIGGPLGGLLADTVGWRWSFIGQGPLILLAIILVSLKLPSSSPAETDVVQSKGKPSKLRRIDFGGAILLAATLVTLLGALSIGGQQLPWSHPLVLSLFTGSMLLCLLFVIYEAKWALEPVLSPSLLIQRDVADCYARTVLQIAAQVSMIFSVPLYFKVTQNASNATAGSHLFPAVLGNTVGGLLAGFAIQKTGRYQSLSIIAHIIAAASYLLLVLRWTGETSWLESMDIIPGGVGTGMASAAMFIALTSSIEKSEVAVATGGLYLATSIGSVSGIAVSSAIQQASLRGLLEKNLGGHGARRIIESVVKDVENVSRLEEPLRRVVVAAYVKSLEYSHVFSLGCAVIALLLALMAREHRLK